MQQICQPDEIKKLGTIVGVWAHPDDESFLAGGILATAVRNGQKVVCITATRGEAGVQDENRWPPAQLAEIRTHEMEQGLHALGITDHHWFNYPDGGCADVPIHEVLPKLVALLKQYQPDTIITFGPEGMTGHPDHQTVSKWVNLATARLPKTPKVFHAVQLDEAYEKYFKDFDEQFDFFFKIDKPPLRPEAACDICYRLPKEVVACKCQALKAMPSQTAAMFRLVPEATMAAMLGIEAFVLQ